METKNVLGNIVTLAVELDAIGKMQLLSYGRGLIDGRQLTPRVEKETPEEKPTQKTRRK